MWRPQPGRRAKASLAGHLGLDNLCSIYDNHHITIEGNTNITFTEDIAARFLGYGWNVLRVGDANDVDLIERALETFQTRKVAPLSPFSTATSVTDRRINRTRRKPMANRLATKKSN